MANVRHVGSHNQPSLKNFKKHSLMLIFFCLGSPFKISGNIFSRVALNLIDLFKIYLKGHSRTRWWKVPPPGFWPDFGHSIRDQKRLNYPHFQPARGPPAPASSKIRCFTVFKISRTRKHIFWCGLRHLNAFSVGQMSIFFQTFSTEQEEMASIWKFLTRN